MLARLRGCSGDFGVGDRDGLGRAGLAGSGRCRGGGRFGWGVAAEGFQADVGVAAAQFGVGGHGPVPGGGGGGFPRVVSGLGLAEPPGQVPDGVLPGGVNVGELTEPLPGLIGLGGFGVAARPVGVDLGAADLPADQGQLIALVLRRPFHFAGELVTPGVQLPVGVLGHVAGLAAEGFGGGLPHGVLLRVLIPGGPNADRLVRMGLAPHLPVGGDQPGLVLPLSPVHRVLRDRAKGFRPRRSVLGGVLAQPPLPVLHRLRQFGPVPVGVRVARAAGQLRPWPGRSGGQPGGVLPDAPVEHLGH